jgi:hypothetical protein
MQIKSEDIVLLWSKDQKWHLWSYTQRNGEDSKKHKHYVLCGQTFIGGYHSNSTKQYSEAIRNQSFGICEECKKVRSED